VRLTIVTNTPAPYRIPLYERIDSLLRQRGGQLSVVYGARSLAARTSAYTTRGRQWADTSPNVGQVESVFVREQPQRLRGRETYADPRVLRRLARTRPDVVIAGGFAPWIYLVAAWCRVRRRPYLIWSGETIATAACYGYSSRRRIPLCRGATGFLAYGPAAASYLRSLDVPDGAITVVGNGIDVQAFALAAESERWTRETVRAKLGLEGRVILSVGGKNIDLVADAGRSLSDTTVAVAGVDSSATLPVGVVALGHLPRAEMPGIYAAADCVAHPVIDQWPHAINEALAAGTPVVASADTGVPPELLTGPGCAIVRPAPEELRPALSRALEASSESSPELRDAIRRPLETWDVSKMAERFVIAAERVKSAD
jgi:glycosyltransferase involved in cell wall biosynthesis